MKLLDEDKIIDLAELYKIFGDSTRIKIINILIDNELCVNQISEKTNVSQSAISHQLRILRENKVIKARREGQNIIYSLDDEHIMQIVNLVKIHVQEEEENGK